MNEAWIIDAVRTPIGRHGGMLAAVRPDDLGAVVLKELVARTGVPAADVEDVYLGCANQAGEDCRNVARMSALARAMRERPAGGIAGDSTTPRLHHTRRGYAALRLAAPFACTSAS